MAISLATMSEQEDGIVGMYVYVPLSLRRAVKMEAAEEDRSMSQVVTSALRAYFKMPKGQGPRKKR